MDAAVRRSAVVWAMAAAVLLTGSIAAWRLPLSGRASVELPRLLIQASWPGSAPEVMEAYVTAPLEAVAQGVRGVRRVNSSSRDGLSMLTVELHPDADVQMARLGILERLELITRELPPGVARPTVSNYVPEGLAESPLMSLVITGPYTPGALSRMLQEVVAPRLSQVVGVAGIQTRGGTTFGASVRYDPARLRQLGMTPEHVTQALRDARVVASLGVLTQGGFERGVVLRDQPASLEAVAALPVVGAAGRRYRLGDLAMVRPEEDARGQFFRIDGRPAVALDVTRHPQADAATTSRALHRAIAEMPPLLPPGAAVRVVNDESVAFTRELRDLAWRTMGAVVSVLIVLGVLLRSWRRIVLVVLATAVSIAGTALTVYLLGVPTNLLTLAGLGMGVGVLVQSAIVVVEQLGRRGAAHTADADVRSDAAWRMAPAVVGSTLTTAVVLLPFLYLQGATRAAFTPFAMAFVIALGWSVVTALVMVPAVWPDVMGAHSRLRAGDDSFDVSVKSHAVRWRRTARAYQRVLWWTLRWRWVTRGVALLGVSAMTWVFIEKVPRSSWGSWYNPRTTVSVSVSFPRGSDPAALDAAMREFERIAVGRAGVEQVRAQGGGTGASLTVHFTRDGGASSVPLQLYEEFAQRGVLIGGASVSVSAEGASFSNGGGGVGLASFRIQVKGFAYEGVERLALDLKARLERISRVREVRITSGGWGFGSGGKGSLITIDPDRGALARAGITAAEFSAAIAREVRGPVGAQRLEIGGEELPVTVKAAGASERDLDALGQTLLTRRAGFANTGTVVARLGDVARIRETEALSSVEREDQQYIRQVQYDFRGPPKLARRTHKALMQSLSAPAGYQFVDLTERLPENDEDGGRGLWLVFALGIALVLLSVALVFDSVWSAGMILLSLPLALTGVVAAFWLSGATFTREAAVGVILVIGLSVNQAILLVDALLSVRRRTGVLSRRAVPRAARERAPMIVLVSATALASLIPLSLGTDTSSLFGSMALATAGGTVAGLLGVLVVMPALVMVSAGRD